MPENPCRTCAPHGGLWIPGPNGGQMRCPNCERGQRLANAGHPTPRPPVLRAEECTVYVEMLASIPFFPAESGARVLIGNQIRSMCGSSGEALWLVERMVYLHGDKWPGPAEMRRVYCAKHFPLDGVPAIGVSEKFPDGIPSENPPAARPLLSAAPISEDHQFAAAVRHLAQAKRLPAPGEPMPAPIPTPRVAQTRAEKAPQIITQADIDEAVEIVRKKKLEEDEEAARREAGIEY